MEPYGLFHLQRVCRASQTHTAQNWADTFISELNDTHIEADLRMRHAPPPVSQPCRPGRGGQGHVSRDCHEQGLGEGVSHTWQRLGSWVAAHMQEVAALLHN
jgi:hypothetical protein